MGLFSNFKRLFNKSVTILPHQRNDMVSFVKLKRGMLKIGSEIVVEENYNFIIVHFNKVCDVLRPGTYKVDEVSVPKLYKYSKAFYTKKGLFTPKTIKTDAYYINQVPFTLNTFKTPERIIAYKDNEKIKIKLEGTFTIKVDDPEKLMKALCNDYAVISNKKAMKEIKNTIGFDVSKILNKKHFTLDDYFTNREKIVEVLNNEIDNYVSNYGLQISNFFINTVILPKKNIVDKPKEEVLNQGSNIDIVKLVEERLNDLENSFAKVEVEKENKNEESFSQINNENTSINKQGDIRINVSSFSGENKTPSGSNNNDVFSMPYSTVPNTQMFNNSNQKEPQLFAEEPSNNNNTSPNEVTKQEQAVNSNNTQVKESKNTSSKSKKGKEVDNVVNDVVNFFLKQHDYDSSKSVNEIKTNKPVVGKEGAEAVISIANKKTKKCVHCGELISEDAKFCSKCGKSTQELVICPCCGAKNFPTAKTCCVCKSEL